MAKVTRPYVFISYSHDDAGFAASLSTRLHREGISHFRDTEAIAWGDSIPDRIHEALDRATHLVVLISPGAEQSQWVSYEMGFARGRGVTLVPYLLHPRMKVPGFLSNLRYLRTREDEAKFFKALKAAAARSTRRRGSRGVSSRNEAEKEIRDAVRNIRSKHPQVRRDGVDSLVELDLASELMKLLGHRDAGVRSAVADGLARLRHEPALPYLADGLGYTSKRSGSEVIPGVEETFAHYKGSALSVLLERMPSSKGYLRERGRWVRAIANSVDKKGVAELARHCTETGRPEFLQALLQSGLPVPKKDLKPAIDASLQRYSDVRSIHADVAKWITDSPAVAAKWLQRMIRGWLLEDISSYGPERNYGSWRTRSLAQSALRIEAITAKELLGMSESIPNQEFRDQITGLARAEQAAA